MNHSAPINEKQNQQDTSLSISKSLALLIPEPWQKTTAEGLLTKQHLLRVSVCAYYKSCPTTQR